MDIITLGPARMDDVSAISHLSRDLVEAGLPWNWTPRRVGAHMRDRESLVVAAKAGRKLIGFAMAQFGDETVHLTLLAVAATHQRLGVGRRLMQWVEESAVVAGLFLVKLEVRAGNRAARRFYASLGYTQSDIVPGYYSGIEDALRLTRDLSKQR